MTFEEILHAAYDDQGYQISGPISPNPSADVIARFKRWANEGLRDLLGRPRLAALRHGSASFISEVGQPVYGIPEEFDVIDTITQPTNDRRLRNMTRDWYRSIDPGERSEGTSDAWIEEGYSPVGRQPPKATGSGVWILSQDGAAAMTVYMRASTLDGIEQPETSATLSGVTPVQIGPYLSYVTIRTLNLSAPAAALTIVYDAPVGGKILAGIRAGTTSTQHHVIRLWPTPSAAEPYLVDGQLKVMQLVNPTDVPFQIPQIYHHALVDYINWKAWTKNGDFTRAQAARADYERRLSELTNKVEFSADYRPVRGGRNSGFGWTNLPGGYFPADLGRW